MPVDVFAVTALAAELSKALEGGRIDKIHMPAKAEVHLIGRAQRGPFRLLLSANPQRARAHLSTVARENPQSPPMFCMLLRKHLTNGRFAGLYQPRLERVLHFYWDAADEMGLVSRKTLVIEMTGRHSNIILADAEGRIIDCLRRVDSEMLPERPVLPGLFYRDPPQRGVLPESAAHTGYGGSVSEYFDGLYTKRDVEEQLFQKASSMTKKARNNRNKLLRKIGVLRQELHNARDREPLRQKADLLMANLHNAKRGDAAVTVGDFYNEGQPVTIKLDTAKSPQQNAAALYKAYAKAKNAEAALNKQITQTESDIEYWESVLDQLSRVSNERDLDEIKEEVTPSRKKSNKTPKVSQPLRFRSSSGVLFRAGRNNRQNDLLTMRMASRNDVWLHTQKIPGCHVIVETNGAEPDDQTLYEAAAVAAWFSAAKTSLKVPVDYTAVKYVKKPPNAKPGMVIYDKFKTLLVEPDGKLAERLQID
jgi:predicted ribosome quality control (RQC) complex YloA/Tae2 family protein